MRCGECFRTIPNEAITLLMRKNRPENLSIKCPQCGKIEVVERIFPQLAIY